MATKIQIRRGDKANLPDLSEGELGFAIDTKEVFIGTSTIDNVQILTDEAGVAVEASQAVKLKTARTIALTGDVTGSVNFDGSANVSITTTVVDDSHNHIIADVDGLQTALNTKLEQSDLDTALEDYTDTTTLDAALALKAPLASPTLTGIPLAPTAEEGTNNTQIATTAFVATSVNNLNDDIQDALSLKSDSTHTHTLDALSDVTITSPSTGQVIKYNGSAWVNDTDSIGEGGETDPVFVGSPAYGIANEDITSWDTAVSWGDHAQEGYLTSSSTLPGTQITSTGVAPGKVLTADGDNSSSWQTPFEWTLIKKLDTTLAQFIIDNTALGEDYDIGNYDYKFVLDVEVADEANTLSDVLLRINGVTNTGSYAFLRETTRITGATTSEKLYDSEYGAAAGSNYLKIGVIPTTVSEDSGSVSVHTQHIEFVIKRPYTAIGGMSISAEAESVLIMSGAAPENILLSANAFSKTLGTIDKVTSLTEVRVNNGFVSSTAVEKQTVKIYKRAK